MATSHMMGRNMGYFYNLPDGVCVFFAVKGSPLGAPGYLGQSVRCLTEGMDDPKNEYAAVSANAKISAILPVRDPATQQATTISYAQGTKVMQAKVFVHVHESVSDNTDVNAAAWSKNIIKILGDVFKVKVIYGGNAGDTVPVPTSLNDFFLTEDVANLAMMGYEESIRNGGFFQDVDLVKKYFGFHSNVLGIFQNMYGIELDEA